MKLDRHKNPDGRGKYALIKLRDTALTVKDCKENDMIAIRTRVIDFGENPETGFFVIRLRDKYAAPALRAYAMAALADRVMDNSEYASEILSLAAIAEASRFKKIPD